MFWLACTDVFDIEKVRPAVFGRVEVLEEWVAGRPDMLPVVLWQYKHPVRMYVRRVCTVCMHTCRTHKR